MFFSLVNLLSLLVCSIHPSVKAAYKAKAEELNVTRGALYQKLNGVETDVSIAADFPSETLRERAQFTPIILAPSATGKYMTVLVR